MNLQDQIRHVLTNRGWDLIGDDDEHAWQTFVRDVAERIGQAESATPIVQERLGRAVIGAYCPVLHAACTEDGSERQRRAFEELWQWIYPRVRQRVDTDQDAEDVAQEVLLKVYRNLHQVTDPRGFLAWVNKVTFRTLSYHYKSLDKRKQRESGSIDGDEDGDALDALAGPDDLLELAVAEEDLVRMIYECMSKGRRHRAEVLVALVLQKLTVAEVADKFQTTPANVHLIYFRARRDLLEHCGQLIEVLLQHLAPSQRRDRAEADS